MRIKRIAALVTFWTLIGGSAFGIGAYLFEDPSTHKSYPNKTVAGYLGVESGGVVELQTGPLPTEGQVLVAGCGTDSATSTATTSCAKFKSQSGSTLPSGSPGQVPTISAVTAPGIVTTTATQTTTGTATAGTYSFTATGTVTTTGTEYTAAALPSNPLGTLYLAEFTNEGAEEPTWIRWRTLQLWVQSSNRSLKQHSGTCSTGSDALIVAFNPDFGGWDTSSSEFRTVFPAGDWIAKLRAKVNANGAAIRVEVDLDDGEGPTPWFNWTTDVFTNTDYETITKRHVQEERLVSYGSRIRQVRLYATCSAETTVTVELNHPAEDCRIESPVLVNATYYTDVIGLAGALWGIENELSLVEPLLSGTPGQFVKFLGTGTSATTSKGAVTIYSTSTPASVATSGSAGTATSVARSDHVHAGSAVTPITTRYLTVPAGDFKIGVGAVASNVSSVLYSWTLRDGQTDQVYGAILDVPADYSSGMSVAVVWSPSATDSNSAHRVTWSLSTQSLTNGNPAFSGGGSWDGKTCGSSCTANYLFKETTTLSLAVNAGTRYALYFSRNHVSGTDTYVGDVRLVALLFSYTSSL